MDGMDHHRQVGQGLQSPETTAVADLLALGGA
jgi:hypothetical protein